MKDACEEVYVFYNFATADLDEASGCLDAIKYYKRGLTIMVMIKNAIIAYSRPFTTCKGMYKSHRLSIKVVPKNFRDLHNKVLHYRDCVIAHTDLDVRNPKLGRYGIMFKGERYYSEDYLALVGEMQVLIREVRSAVHNMAIEYRKRFIK